MVLLTTTHAQELEMMLPIYDEFFYSRKIEVYQNFYENKLFCDSNGHIFKVVGHVHPTQLWRRLFWFLPNAYKGSLVFKNTGKTINLEDLKSYFIKEWKYHLTDIDLKGARDLFISFQKARSFEKLIGGE